MDVNEDGDDQEGGVDIVEAESRHFRILVLAESDILSLERACCWGSALARPITGA